jgi:hypothetical protein
MRELTGRRLGEAMGSVVVIRWVVGFFFGFENLFGLPSIRILAFSER